MSLQVGVPYTFALGCRRRGERETQTQIHTSIKSGQEKKHSSIFSTGENKLIRSFLFLSYKKQSGGYMYGGSFLLDWLISPRPSFSLLLPTWS